MEPKPIKNIVFIEPRSPDFHVYSRWGLPRLGIIVLGTILKNRGYNVQVFVEDIKGINFADVLKADAVGISTITSTAPRAYEIADILRKENIPVFMGGTHVTFMPNEALKHCNFVLRGEAEDTIIPFIEALSKEADFDKVRGLSYRSEDNQIIHNQAADKCLCLDKYPSPDLSLIHGNTLKKTDRSITPIMTSRGCPFGCTFCSVTRMFGRQYRFRSVENVISELERLKPKRVFFYDDNFAANRKHTKELLNEITLRGINIEWFAQVRIDIAKDPELLELMRQSRCRCLYIGLESINSLTLKALNKNQTVEEIEDAIKIIHSYGIKIHGMFIFGTDEDDISTIRKTVKFAKKLKIESVQFLVLTPLPGTPVFEKLDEEGRLISKDWSYYDAHHVVFRPRNMNFWELQKETIKAMVRFYSIGQILRGVLKFDLWTIVIRSYGRRLVHKSKRASRDFSSQLKNLCKQAGSSMHNRGIQIQLKARKKSDDLLKSIKKINQRLDK